MDLEDIFTEDYVLESLVLTDQFSPGSFVRVRECFNCFYGYERSWHQIRIVVVPPIPPHVQVRNSRSRYQKKEGTFHLFYIERRLQVPLGHYLSVFTPGLHTVSFCPTSAVSVMHPSSKYVRLLVRDVSGVENK